MTLYGNKTSYITKLSSLDYSTIYPEAPDQTDDAKTIEKTQKAALLIQTAWKERNQKKGTFKVVLNPQIKIGSAYANEVSSLELGLKDKKGNQLAIYQNGYRTLTETEKEWLKDPNVSSEKKIESLRAKKLVLTTYFSDKQLQARQLSNLESKRLARCCENCVVIKDGKIYAYPKIRADSDTAKTKAARNHSSASSGKPVDFSGTIDKINGRWKLSNLSGHYQTRASKLNFCLKTFQKAGIPLENIDVQHYILVDVSYVGRVLNPSFKIEQRFFSKDKRYLVKTTNAIEWMKQTSKLRCEKETLPEKLLSKKIYDKKNSCCTVS